MCISLLYPLGPSPTVQATKFPSFSSKKGAPLNKKVSYPVESVWQV